MRSSLLILAVLFLFPSLSAAQSLDQNVVDKLNGSQAKEAQAAIEVAVETFKKRFLDNVPEISNARIAGCNLIADLSVRSALKEYGKNPQVTDMIMLTLSAQQRAWSALYAKKVEGGADLHVGQAVEIFQSQNHAEISNFIQSEQPVCGEIFQKAQVAGLAKERGKK